MRFVLINSASCERTRRLSDLACRWFQAEWPFNGDPWGSGATPCNLQADVKNYQIDEAVNGVAHFANR